MAVIDTTEYENLIIGGERTYEGVLADGESVVRGELVGREAGSAEFKKATDTVKPEAIVIQDTEASGSSVPLAIWVKGDFNIGAITVDAGVDMDIAKIDLAKYGIFLRTINKEEVR